MSSKRSVFYKLLISYILISAVPILVMGGLLYYLNVVNLKKDITESNLSKLTQIRDQIDYTLNEIKNISIHLSNNPDFISENVKRKDGKAADVVSKIQAYKSNNPLIEEVMFYFRGDEEVFLTQGNFHYSMLEDQLTRNIDWTQANFFKSLNTVTMPTFKRVNKKDAVQPGSRRLVYMFPLPIMGEIPQSTVAFTMKETDLLELIENIIGEYKGYIYVFDSSYNILISRNMGVELKNPGQIEKTLRGLRGTGVFDIELEHKSYQIMRLVSKDTGWNYVVAIQSDSFFGRVTTMRNLVLGIILILALLGLSIALAMAVSNYKPIKSILAYIINQNQQSSEDGAKNEFEFIVSTLDRAITKNRELIVQVDTQRPLVKDQCLVKVLTGKVKGEQELDYLLKSSNLKLAAQAYFVMVFSVRHIAIPYEQLEKYVNMLENMFFTGGRGYGVEIIRDKSIALLISLEEMNNATKETQMKVAQDITQHINESFGWKPAIGISNIYDRLMKVNASYVEATTAVNDSRINDENNIYFFCDIEKDEKQYYWYPVMEQALFIQSLKQGDKVVAIDSLKVMVEKISRATASYLMIRCLCFDILNNIIKTINQMNMESFAGDIKGLVEFASLEEFGSRMEAFSIKFCEYVDKLKESRNSELKNNIISYVNDNFKDSNISLERIAECFDISITYLSRFFKEETGVNFIEYLTSLRMEEAKNLLRSTDLAVKDIVREIGYIDAASFARKFKSMEGITPIQYRALS